YSVYSYTSLFADAGLTAIYVGSREEAMEEALGVILEVLQDFGEDIAEEAIARAKNHLKGQLVISMESPGSRMQSLGRAVLMEQPILTVDEVLERIDAVTHDDVMAAVRRYYDPNKWSTVCIGPRAEPFRAVTDGFDWEER
ncbi:MAG TPA: insulinase family protein, partial [Thermoleophilia bacterium]|nr:insulinase family protein [Thermoleophilia bacterium]